MKKIILLAALLPLSVFANEGGNLNTYSLSTNNCENVTDAQERKDCLVIAKKNEARENYKNFQENNHGQEQADF
jgi:hypothetical protein